jgi:hypothetical protein
VCFQNGQSHRGRKIGRCFVLNYRTVDDKCRPVVKVRKTGRLFASVNQDADSQISGDFSEGARHFITDHHTEERCSSSKIGLIPILIGHFRETRHTIADSGKFGKWHTAGIGR